MEDEEVMMSVLKDQGFKEVEGDLESRHMM